MRSPWWFCCGWWSPWCIVDTLAHKLGLPLDTELADKDEADEHRYSWICRRHDAAIERHSTRRGWSASID